jgi:mono/diheme cytochrome c family protein
MAFVALVTAGCGSKSSTPSDSGAASSAAGAPAASTPGVLAEKSKFDDGPRANASPVVEAQVAEGEQLFKTKGCSACHGWGVRLSCPDLKGVTTRRTAEWMRQQILHPEVMTKTDPISHGLMATYSLQMPNQGLTPEQAEKVIEHLKSRDQKGK